MNDPQAQAGGIRLTEDQRCSIVDMWGEIDGALRPQASLALASALDRDLPVIIDTSQVTFMDSTGIAFLVQFYTIGREEGLSVTLRNPPSVVSDVLAMLGVDGFLVESSVDLVWSDLTSADLVAS